MVNQNRNSMDGLEKTEVNKKSPDDLCFDPSDASITPSSDKSIPNNVLDVLVKLGDKKVNNDPKSTADTNNADQSNAVLLEDTVSNLLDKIIEKRVNQRLNELGITDSNGSLNTGFIEGIVEKCLELRLKDHNFTTQKEPSLEKKTPPTKEESNEVAEDKLQDNDYLQRISELDKKLEKFFKEWPQDGKFGSGVREFCKFIYEIENREKFKNLDFQENEISKNEFVLAWKEFCIYMIEKDKNFSKRIQNSIEAFTQEQEQEESLKLDGDGDLYSKLLKEFENKYIKKFFANYYSKELCFVFGKVKINLEDIISPEPNKTENEGEG